MLAINTQPGIIQPIIISLVIETHQARHRQIYPANKYTQSIKG